MTIGELTKLVRNFNPTPEQIEAFHKRLDELDRQFEEKERAKANFDYDRVYFTI